MKTKEFLNITVETDEESKMATINIDGQIGENPYTDSDEQNTVQNVRDKLKEIAKLDVETIDVNINSLGGSVDTGLAIHDLLRQNPAKVITKINGMSASSATIIFQAGDERHISTNAMMLIHRAWTFGSGNANDFEALVKDLKKTDDVIANIYAKRGGKDKDYYMNLMNENSGDGIWLDADEAVESGLVDEAIEPVYKKVAMDKSLLKDMGLPVPEIKAKASNPTPLKVDVELNIDASQIKELDNIISKQDETEESKFYDRARELEIYKLKNSTRYKSS